MIVMLALGSGLAERQRRDERGGRRHHAPRHVGSTCSAAVGVRTLPRASMIPPPTLRIRLQAELSRF